MKYQKVCMKWVQHKTATSESAEINLILLTSLKYTIYTVCALNIQCFLVYPSFSATH